MTDQSAQIDWQDDGVPISRQFKDPYFSAQDGLAETRHVFLDGNDLPARFRPGFHIAELGFGTGLNVLAAWQAWEQAGITGNLSFTSFEAFPMAPADMATALRAFPDVADRAGALLAHWHPGGAIRLPGLTLNVIIGDARQTLAGWDDQADAWFLDGFSPAKNPELWEPPLMRAVAQHTNAGGTVATYTAAGHIRRSLGEAGFNVQRLPGFGRKRHMTAGRITP